MDSHALVWPLELGIQTLTLQCGPWSWGYRLLCFCVATSFRDIDLHDLVWFFELGSRIPTLLCGPFSWGYVL